MQQLDYSSLQTKHLSVSSLRYLKGYTAPWYIGLVIILLVIIAGLGLAAAAVAAFLTHSSSWTEFAATGAFLSIGGLLGLSDITSVLQKNAIIEQFARRNGLSFAKDDVPSDYSGIFFDKGLVRITDRLRFPGQLMLEIGNFKPLMQNQERSRAGSSHGYIRIKLPKQLPNMLLASKAGTLQLPIPAYLSSSQQLSLEGNFNDIFTLFVPKDYKRDALYIFTPDVMEKFIDLFGTFSSEIIGDEIYFYGASPLDLTKATTYDAVLPLVGEFLRKFDKQISNYRDERVDQGMPATVGSRSYPQTAVAKGGRKLHESRLSIYAARGITIVALLALAGIIFAVLQPAVTDKNALDMRLRIFISVMIMLTLSAVIGFLKTLIVRRGIKKRRSDKSR